MSMAYGPLHAAALAAVKRFNRLLCMVKSRIYRPLIRSQGLASELPPAERILILSPHIDDEAIGCAGLIYHYVGKGARVVCVYLTDSAGGRKGAERRAYTAERIREGKTACRLLGIRRVYFLGQPDGRLAPVREMIEKLREIAKREAPQLLLLPYPNDPHPDHRAAASIAAAAFRKRPSGRTVLFYQLRAPIPLEEIHLTVDTGNFFNAKRELLYTYRSQPRFIFDLALHLQQCQGVLLEHHSASVEVFSKADLENISLAEGDETTRHIVRHLQVGLFALHRRRGKPDAS